MGVKRAGLAFYLSKLYGVLVGMAFILLVTRNLAPSEYGAWSVVSSILSYASLATLTNYWVTRFRARGEKAALPTGLALSGSFAAAASTALVALSGAVSEAFNVPHEVILLAAAYVPFLYVNSALYAAVYAVSPGLAAASEYAFETGKLAAALAFAAVYRVTLQAAMLAVLAGHAAQTVVLLLAARGEVAGKPSMELARRTLAYSWVNALSLPATLLALADVPLLSHYASNTAVAYYTVVLAFSNLVGYSYALGRGLYPSLLSSPDNAHERVEDALSLTLLLAVPTAVGAAVLAPNLLYVLNPQYEAAAPVLRAAALAALVGAVNSVLSDTLQGVEKLDAERASAAALAKSLLFKTTLVGLGRAALGLAGVAASILLARGEVELAVLARLSWLAAELFALACLYSLASRLFSARVVAARSAKFLLASIPMAAVVALVDPWRIREVFLAAAAGAAVYFSALAAVDGWFRGLVKTASRYARPQRSSKSTP